MNRNERLAYIKGEYRNHSTRAELARVLGVHPQTVKRWWKDGTIPPPDATARNGWNLWSPEQVRRMIQSRTNRGDKS